MCENVNFNCSEKGTMRYEQTEAMVMLNAHDAFGCLKAK